MRIVLGYVILYIAITLGSIFISSVTNKKIEKTIAINMCSIILILYLFGIINQLQIGICIILILNILLGIIAIIKQKKNIFKLVATPGFAFFSIVYFILMITTYNKQLVDWDHFTYRSFNVKIMYYTDTMTRGYELFYPPAATLLEYFFMEVIGVYRQGIEAFTMQLFGISLLLPIYENVKEHKIAKIAVGMIIACIPAVFTNLIFYESAYQDATLGLLLGYMIYIYFTEENLKCKIVFISIAMSVLLLMKASGIVIALALFAIFALYEFLHNKYIIKGKIKTLLKSKNIRAIFIIGIISFAFLTSWENVQKINQTENNIRIVRPDQIRAISENKGPIEFLLNSIMTTVFGTYQENNDAAESNGNLISTLYSVTGLFKPVRLSLMTTSIIFIIAYIYYYYKIKDEKFKFQTVTIGIGLFIYTILLQVAYLIKFSDYEMLNHNGIDRYYATFLLGMLYFISAIVISNLNKTKYDSKKYVAMLLIILLITPLQSIANVTITSGIYNINSTEYINNAKNRADQINEYIEDDAKLVTISQSDKTTLYNIMLKYYLYPEHSTSVLSGLQNNDYSIKFLKDISKYNDYIYIFTKNKKLDEIIKDTFENITEVKENTLYKIQYTNEEDIKLIEEKHIDQIMEENI